MGYPWTRKPAAAFKFRAAASSQSESEPPCLVPLAGSLAEGALQGHSRRLGVNEASVRVGRRGGSQSQPEPSDSDLRF